MRNKLKSELNLNLNQLHHKREESSVIACDYTLPGYKLSTYSNLRFCYNIFLCQQCQK